MCPIQTHGRVKLSPDGYPLNNTIQLNCNSRSIIVGDKVRQWLSDGTWSGFNADCHGKHIFLHNIFSNIPIIRVELNGYYSLSFARS